MARIIGNVLHETVIIVRHGSSIITSYPGGRRTRTIYRNRFAAWVAYHFTKDHR